MQFASNDEKIIKSLINVRKWKLPDKFDIGSKDRNIQNIISLQTSAEQRENFINACRQERERANAIYVWPWKE